MDDNLTFSVFLQFIKPVHNYLLEITNYYMQKTTLIQELEGLVADAFYETTNSRDQDIQEQLSQILQKSYDPNNSVYKLM